MTDTKPTHVEVNAWQGLRQFTAARIALGRVGASLPTAEVLAFGLAHAQARDAVHAVLDVPRLKAELEGLGLATEVVCSNAPDRPRYLLRPDLGRTLHPEAAAHLGALKSSAEIVFVLADGLSAVALQAHAAPLLTALLPQLHPAWTVAPVVIATQARVALGDEVGECFRARLLVMLIGERPGLSSPDSLGAYVTYLPRKGRSDAERNCVSNIRPAGLDYTEAARKLGWLIGEALQRQLTGVSLKDESDTLNLPR